MNDGTEAALAATFRDEWPRLVAATMWITGDLQAAEDVVQETLITALDHWPLLGIPERPGAWLMTACRNRARNVIRDAGRADQRSRALRPLLTAAQPGPEVPPEIPDDRLRLIAMCCHPLLPASAQVALTLRMVAGLTTEEIARGFHLPAATIAQRIVRAKRTLAAHRVTFAADEPGLGGRLPSIIDVVYLVFNEGYLPSTGGTLTRGDLALEAHRLAGLLTESAAGEPEPWALRALLSFHLSRQATRTGADGVLLTLDVQDRSRWDQGLIRDGAAALRRAREFGARGPLLLQAELAAAHATAPAFADTDWPAIVALYDELLGFQDTPVVALNRAVALAMAVGPAVALPLVSELSGDPSLRGSHRVWSVRADLHRRLGDTAAALADYDRAISLASNDVERRYLADARDRLIASQRGPIVPTFHKSPPELITRFDELAELTGEADRKQMFGYPACVLRGNMFMGLHEDSLILRLADTDRAEFLSRYHAALFEPMPGRPMKEYVVVPPTLVSDDAVKDWVRRSLAYAGQLPAKKPAKKG